MIFNRIICFYSLLFLVGCGGTQLPQHPDAPAQPDSQPTSKRPKPEKLPALEKHQQDLVARFIETLAKSGAFKSKNPLDVIIILADYREKALKLVNEPVVRASEFLEELKADKKSLENIVHLKNTYLNATASDVTQEEPLGVKLEKIANNDRALDALMAIKDSFYTKEGELSDDAKLLKKILFEAASDPGKQRAFLAGQAYSRCKEQPGWVPCAPSGEIDDGGYSYMWTLWSFKGVSLERNIRAFTALTAAKSELDDDELTWAAVKLMSIINYDSLSFFHQFVQGLTKDQLKEHLLYIAGILGTKATEEQEKLLAELKPQLPGLGYFLFEFYTGNKLPDLTSNQLHNLLDQLILLLKKSEPRGNR